jgi:hypothetical protein
VPGAGKYQIGAASRSPRRRWVFRIVQHPLNGSTYIAEQVIADGLGRRQLTVPTLYDLAINDYVEVDLLSGHRLEMTIAVSNANSSPEFWMVRVA